MVSPHSNTRKLLLQGSRASSLNLEDPPSKDTHSVKKLAKSSSELEAHSKQFLGVDDNDSARRSHSDGLLLNPNHLSTTNRRPVSVLMNTFKVQANRVAPSDVPTPSKKT